MGVLNVFILFICVTQNIALTQNEAVSRLPAVQPQIPTDSTYRPQTPPAKECTIPVYPNVLYLITPKATNKPVSYIDPVCPAPVNSAYLNNVSSTSVNSVNVPTNPPTCPSVISMHQTHLPRVPVNPIILPVNPPISSAQLSNLSSVPVNQFSNPLGSPLNPTLHPIYSCVSPTYPTNPSVTVAPGNPFVNVVPPLNPSVNVPPLVNPMNPSTNEYSSVNPTVPANCLYPHVNPLSLPPLNINPPVSPSNPHLHSIEPLVSPQYSSVNPITPPASSINPQLNYINSLLSPQYSPGNPITASASSLNPHLNPMTPLSQSINSQYPANAENSIINPAQPLMNNNSPLPSNLPSISPQPTVKPVSRENFENLRMLPQGINTENKHNDSTRYLKLSSDNSLYPVFTVDTSNYYKDVQYFQLTPAMYNYNSSDMAYLLPYPNIYVNQLERRGPDNVSNTKSPYQEAIPIRTNVRADLNKNRDTIYPVEYKSKETIEIIPEPKTTSIVTNPLPEKIEVLMKNDAERAAFPHSVDLKKQSLTLPPPLFPRKGSDNKEILQQISHPTNPLEITDHGIQNGVKSYEKIIEDTDGIQSAKQREIESFDRLRSSYRPVYSTEHRINPQISQDQHYLPISNIPVIPNDKVQNHCHNMPFNSVKEAMSNKDKTELINAQEFTNLRTPIIKERRLDSPINVSQSPARSFKPEKISENEKVINKVENTIDGISPRSNGQQNKKEPVLNPYNDIFLTRIQNKMNQPCPPCPSEKPQENEKNVMKNLLKESKNITSLANQNISFTKQGVNNDCNMGYRDLQKQLDKIRQENTLPRMPVQPMLEKEQKHLVIDKNDGYIPRKIANVSQIPKNENSHYFNNAHNVPRQKNIEESKDMPARRFSSNRLLPNTQGRNISDSSIITKGFNNELGSKKLEPENVTMPSTAMDYQNKINTLISKTKHMMKTDKTVSVQDPSTIYDKSGSVNHYINKIEKESVSRLNDMKQMNPPKQVPHLNNISLQKSNVNTYKPVSSPCEQKQTHNLVKTPINNREINQRVPAKDMSTSYFRNPSSNTELYESRSKFVTNGIQESLKEGLDLANDPFKTNIPSENTLEIQPVNQYERYMNYVKAKAIEPKEKEVTIQNCNNKVPPNLIKNNVHNVGNNHAYQDQVKNSVNVQYSDGYYGTQNRIDYKKIEPVPNTPINILPVPIEPTIIPKPATSATLGKARNIEQPQVYTRVSSSTHTNPQVVNHPDPIHESKAQHIVSNSYQSTPCEIVSSRYQNASPSFESIRNNIPLDGSNANENLYKPSLSQRVVINTNPPNQFSSSIDEYTSLISSSINNIGSVLVTNLLSTLNTNILKSINSLGTSLDTAAPTNILNINLPLIHPEISTPVSEVPLFSVIPPCVVSPRFLPEPCVEIIKEISATTESVLKSKKISKSQKKSLETKPSISTITINVVPAVQQTTNDIIILV